MKNTFLILCLFTATVNTSCNFDNNKTNSNGQDVTPVKFELLCQQVEEPNMQTGAPQHEVFLQVGENKVKMADILSCETLTKDLYEQYQIPENAISAVGGWWAGAGDYFYVAEEEGVYVVKQGEMYEEKEDLSYDYKIIARFSKTGKQEL